MFWVRVLPWWVFVLLALFAGLITRLFIGDYLEERSLLSDAIETPPELITLQDLPTTDLPSPLNEFLITGFSGGLTGLFETDRSTRAFLLLASTGTPTVYLGFDSLRFEEDEFAEKLNAMKPDTEIRGLLNTSNFYRSELLEALSAEGTTIEPSAVFMADFLEGDREAALRAKVDSGRLVALLSAGVAAIFLIIAGIKFRAWRRRRAG